MAAEEERAEVRWCGSTWTFTFDSKGFWSSYTAERDRQWPLPHIKVKPTLGAMTAWHDERAGSLREKSPVNEYKPSVWGTTDAWQRHCGL